jgi:Tfp pilus assembly protein PilV
MTQIKTKKTESGFALLITILVISVVVSVTLAIVQLSLQQLKLSVDSTDSEIAFHAANAGLECARYTRKKYSDSFEAGTGVSFNCFGQNIASTMSTFSPIAGTGRATDYKGEIEWGAGTDIRCTVIDILSVVATTSVTVGAVGANSLKNDFSGYETDTKVCDAGGRCTIMSAVGYSSACANKNVEGTLKREILLEL